jgi:hypothetical protein
VAMGEMIELASLSPAVAGDRAAQAERGEGA